MITLLYIGVALSLALLLLSMWHIRRRKRAIWLADQAEEISPHPNAISFSDLELGETVHCQTKTGTRFSFRVIDREIGFFEIHCQLARQIGQPWIGGYVMGTVRDGKQHPGQFVPGGEIYFQSTVEEDGVEHSIDATTEVIDRLFRTPYDVKKDKL